MMKKIDFHLLPNNTKQEKAAMMLKFLFTAVLS